MCDPYRLIDMHCKEWNFWETGLVTRTLESLGTKVRCSCCKHRGKPHRIIKHLQEEHDMSEADAYRSMGVEVPEHLLQATKVAREVVTI